MEFYTFIDNIKRTKLKPKLSADTIKNVPDAFKKYRYFIVDKNRINDSLSIPDNYFTKDDNTNFDKLYTMRLTNENFNKHFINRFKLADFGQTLSDFFDKIFDNF